MFTLSDLTALGHLSHGERRDDLSDLAMLGYLAFCIGKGKKLKLVSFIFLHFIFLSGHRVQAGIQNHPVKAFP